MDEVLPMQPSSFEDNFCASSNNRNNRPSSPSSPFTFDLRISDFSASASQGNMSMSFSMSGTPAYSDAGNPFFQSGFDDKKAVSTLQPAFMTEQDAKEGVLDLSESQRKRALQRLSLGSSVASSASSTAPSEAEDDREWDSFAGPERNSCDMYRKDSQMERAYIGLSHAFSQQQLAGPCSFNGREGEAPELSQARSQTTLGPDLGVPATMDPRMQDAGVFPNFNLEDFIADAEHQGEGTAGHHQAAASEGAPDSFASFATSHPHFDRHLPAEILNQFPDLDSNLLSLASARAQGGEGVSLTSLPMTPQPSFSEIDRPGSAVSTSSHTSSIAGNEQLRFSNTARSLSFSGQATPSLSMQPTDIGAAVAGSISDRVPPVHASLLRVRKPETPVRSSSTPNIHDTLSCNPAHIAPTSAAEVPMEIAAPSLPPYLASGAAPNLFGGRFDFPDSPTSSAMSSPPHWTPGLHNEDPGEETYRQTHYSAAANYLSSSLPVRPTLLRAHTSALSMPASPTSGVAGQPMRPTRSTAVGQPSPYGSPASHGVSPIRHHVLPPNHPLAHLQNPYSGVITKRSRGRRVPNTPEEMTNVGKSGKVYTCKVPGCGKLFKRSEHLKRHIRSIHTDEKPYQCQVCHKRFSRHDNLNQHMRVHGSGGSSAGIDSATSSAGDSPASSPLQTSSRCSSRSESFAETRGGTITRRNFRSGAALEDGVFDFDDGVEDGDVKLLSL